MKLKLRKGDKVRLSDGTTSVVQECDNTSAPYLLDNGFWYDVNGKFFGDSTGQPYIIFEKGNIPCIMCDKKMWNAIRPLLAEWRYETTEYAGFVEGKDRVLVLNLGGDFGCVASASTITCPEGKHNRYLEPDVHKFLDKAAKLMGKAYIKPHCLVSELPKRIRRLAEYRTTNPSGDTVKKRFIWHNTLEGHDFWEKIDDGIIPDNLEEVLTNFEQFFVEESTSKMALDLARDMRDNLAETLEIIKSFDKEELNPLPKTWEEWVEQHPNKSEECYFSEISCLGCPSGSSAKAHFALLKLERLRDLYRQGWKPDWKNDEVKFCICVGGGDVFKGEYLWSSHVLSFQDGETRDLFLENFKDLIEQAKELL